MLLICLLIFMWPLIYEIISFLALTLDVIICYREIMMLSVFHRRRWKIHKFKRLSEGNPARESITVEELLPSDLLCTELSILHSLPLIQVILYHQRRDACRGGASANVENSVLQMYCTAVIPGNHRISSISSGIKKYGYRRVCLFVCLSVLELYSHVVLTHFI